MEERQFRIVLTVLALVAVAVLAVGIVSVSTDSLSAERTSVRDILKIIGMGLLPIAAIGLWSWRPWGFGALGLATAVALLSALPDGLHIAIWNSFPHLTTILLVVEHHYARNEAEDEAEAEHSSDAQH